MGLTSQEAKRRMEYEGPNEIAEKHPSAALRLARKFWGPSAWMVEVIALVSLILHKRADLSVALLLLGMNAIFSFSQEQRATSAIAALRQKLNLKARALRDGRWQTVPTRTLVKGDIVRVRAGDFVPADMQLFEGVVQVDQSALTGETHEIDKGHDDVLHSGSTVRHGEASGVVIATGTHTYFGRTVQLVESARPKLHSEAVITRLVKWMCAIVGALVATTWVVSQARGIAPSETLPIALVLMMGAVPVALPAMLTASMAISSIALARRGVLITRLNAVEDAATMDVLCADKTGTLTMNRLSFGGIAPQPGFDSEDVIRAGALASNAANADPIDRAFLQEASARGILEKTAKPRSFKPFSATTRHTRAVVEIDGRAVHAVKGALRTVAKAAGLDRAAIAALEARAEQAARQGMRALAVARAEDDQPLQLVGLAFLYDAPRPDAQHLIDKLRALGIQIKMLTGDALIVAREIARMLGLHKILRAPKWRAMQQEAHARAENLANCADGFAEVYPEDKFQIVQSLQAAGHIVGMTGDGVNDAPALRQAEVGIAVRGASDVAKGAASVVLTAEGLAGIIDLIRHGRAIHQRVLTWIINKISRTTLKAGFVVVVFLVTGKFAISALAMILLVLMTDFVQITMATDRVDAPPEPQTWEITPFARVALALGGLMLIEALALLAFGWHHFGLAGQVARLQTFTFQTLLFFGLFSILSVRERRAFWTSRPSAPFAAAIAIDACAGLWIGIYGLGRLHPLPLAQSALIFSYAGFCTLGLNDFVKIALIARCSA
ncbi:ATPase, E1-E2 type [Candidatus Glomeribacter gigasporarum BEG34]|uniref:ATPase, E1-E2 type n=1 Tax=Candidatus Glomeribacter gigasporarum BEG34 TaxID=1070319 RepID=G2JB23_9BURK|nr:plasma-membrane proton-efflux P-type ATPase [Candidatus Glomeribacter gigasporarum]CCD29975.1 ATPase, E1-E2 type [Candidatus Glomeribacter gigasporarum BEG34]